MLKLCFATAVCVAAVHALVPTFSGDVVADFPEDDPTVFVAVDLKSPIEFRRGPSGSCDRCRVRPLKHTRRASRWGVSGLCATTRVPMHRLLLDVSFILLLQVFQSYVARCLLCLLLVV
jgi:hypothetical protein